MHAVEFSKIGRTNQPATKQAQKGNFTIIPHPHQHPNHTTDPKDPGGFSARRARPNPNASYRSASTVRSWGGSLLEGAGPSGRSALPFGANNKNITSPPTPTQNHTTPRACRERSGLDEETRERLLAATQHRQPARQIAGDTG